MERSEVLEAMGELKLFGMRGAYDEIVATAVKRQHEPQRVVGDLLDAEINEKKARSIKYQMTIATPEALRLRHEPAADCARYDRLRRATG